MSDKNEDGILYDKLIYENEAKFYQLRLTVSNFRDIQYLNVRKYFLSYESEWIPSKEGISMEAGIDNIKALLEGLVELCSKEECREVMTRYFKDRISELDKS